MHLETKFLRLRTPVEIDSLFGGGQFLRGDRLNIRLNLAPGPLSAITCDHLARRGKDSRHHRVGFVD